MENTKFERRSRRKKFTALAKKAMKKVISMILAAAVIMSLAACGPKKNSEGSSSSGEGATSGDGITSVPSAAINNQQEEFTKKIVPLDFEPGESISGSLYYREGVGDDGPYYEFQVEGEEEPTQVPVSQCVIYTVEDPADCKVSKVVFDYEIQGQEPQHIEQYRIFSIAVASITVNGENQDGQDNNDTDAGSSAEMPVTSGSGDPADSGNVPDTSTAANPVA